MGSNTFLSEFAAKENLPDEAHMLLLMRRDGTIRFFTHATRPEPRAGDTILSYIPPPARTPEAAAARRAQKKGQPA